MARWDEITSVGDVEDRRGMGPVSWLAGGGGIIAILITIGLNFLGLNVSPGTVQDVVNNFQSLNGSSASQTEQDPEFRGADSYEVFAQKVLGSTNDTWTQVFARNNLTYQEPKLVLFRDATQSGCGVATSQVGPHFCPGDASIYLDETFFDELHSKYGADKGEVAQAYVIAHEVGHNVQSQLGAFGQNGAASNEESVQIELQADCYAGVWAYSIKQLGIFEGDEINQAISAAGAVGDDRIQEAAQGYTNPESWTHGSSEQRVAAFTRGYESGKPGLCSGF